MNLKLALRTLLKSPFVTLIAVVSLALGVGANSAIFSLFDQILLRSLPVQEPDRLVNLVAPGPKPGSRSADQAGGVDHVFSYPMFRDLERQQTALAGLAAHRSFGANLAYEGQTASGEGLLVSGGYFPTLGLKPALGRLLDGGDDQAVGESSVVVLSHDYWRSRFAESPDVLNRSLIVNGQPLTVAGVAPAGFRGTTLGSRPDVFVPITLRGTMIPGFDGFENRRDYWAYLFGRLPPGVTLEEARAGLNVPYVSILEDVEAPLQTGMSEATLATFKERRLELEEGWRGQSETHQVARTPMILLLAVAGVVLLIACGNVANLLLARSVARGGEIAVRLSIGASRGRLISQLLGESCLLAVLGGLAGLLAAGATLDLIRGLVPPTAGMVVDFALNGRVVLFAAALALLTGFLFGLFPALHSTRLDLATVLRGNTGQPAGARSAARFRAGLVTAQIALSMALLMAAGLFTRSLLKVGRVDLGIEVENLVTFSIAPELNGYTPDSSRQLFERLESELAALPGVESVTASMVPAIAGSSWGSNVSVEGFTADPDTDTNSNFNLIGPGYFRTMGVPLVTGRELTDADVLGAPKVAVVNEAFARKFGLGRQAVGRHMARSRSDELDVEIVGLVADAKYSEVKSAVPPQFFFPYRQDERLGYINFYVRTVHEPTTVMGSIPGVVRRLDPNLPVDGLKTMPQQVRESVFLDRMITTLSASFAGLATLLAAVGLYGVLAFTVAQRTREIGLRMALGADSARVRWLVFRQVGVMVLVGGVVGLAGAVGLGYLASSQLYEVQGADPFAMAASVVFLSLVAFGAGLVPARKASRVDPMVALRYE